MTEAPAGLPSSGDETEGGEYLFEKAYSLYRLHREDDATRVLGKMKANSEETGEEMDRGVLHLEAQLVRLSYCLNADVVLKVDGCRRTGKETTRPRLICTTNCWTQLNRCVSCFHLV